MRKLINVIIVAGFLTVALTGCNDKKIDMTPSSQAGEQNSVTVPAVSEKPSSVDETDNNKLSISEKYQLVDDNGKSYTCNVSLKYELDPNTKFDVIEAKPFEPNAENKEKLVKAVYGDNEVYSGDEKDLSVSELRELIAYYEKEIESITGDTYYENDFKETYRAKISELEELIKNAPEKSSPITDYDHELFLGRVPGIDEECAVYVSKDYDNRVAIQIGRYIPGFVPSIEIAAPVRHSIDEATKILESFTEKVGLAPMTFLHEWELTTYLFGIKPFGYLICQCDVLFNNDNVVSAQIVNPFMEIKTYEDAIHLPLSEIEEVLKYVIKNESHKYFETNNSGNMYIDKISLKHSLFCKDGMNYYAPAWVINGKLAINALDGTYTEYDPAMVGYYDFGE